LYWLLLTTSQSAQQASKLTGLQTSELQPLTLLQSHFITTPALRRKRKAEADAAAAAAPKKRLKKDTKLLSFGEDEEGDDDDADGAAQPDAHAKGRRGGIRSAHDVRNRHVKPP